MRGASCNLSIRTRSSTHSAPPGVGAIVALTFRSAVDNPDRFPRSRDVGAWAGLTPRRWQSGMTDITGRITKAGDPHVRVMLFEAAASILGRARVMSPLKAWGLRIAQRTSMKKAIVAVSRKLAMILLAMWKSGTAYWATGRPPASAQDLASSMMTTSMRLRAPPKPRARHH
ncbi:transposase [Pseudodonghicola sp.]|uniref:transposase n=1 Tax=Pseudodonghicola sp. TaxID=1969463 RepID=UPI003A968E14